MNVVLVHPEIPPNTGNIARTCAATDTVLHLVRPLGFSLSSRQLQRAGLDYWHLLDIKIYNTFDELIESQRESTFYYCTPRSSLAYSQVRFNRGDFLVFGSETKGLPDQVLARDPRRHIRLPMRSGARSLNLASAVAVVLYEALRQQGFPGLTPGDEMGER